MKLLIVDDEVDLCFLLQEHFKEHFDGEVFAATTPGEALRLLEELQPEGMLLDIGYADGIPPALAMPERPVPNGSRAG